MGTARLERRRKERVSLRRSTSLACSSCWRSWALSTSIRPAGARSNELWPGAEKPLQGGCTDRTDPRHLHAVKRSVGDQEKPRGSWQRHTEDGSNPTLLERVEQPKSD